MKSVYVYIYNVNDLPLPASSVATLVSKALALLIESSATFTNTCAMMYTGSPKTAANLLCPGPGGINDDAV